MKKRNESKEKRKGWRKEGRMEGNRLKWSKKQNTIAPRRFCSFHKYYYLI